MPGAKSINLCMSGLHTHRPRPRKKTAEEEMHVTARGNSHPCCNIFIFGSKHGHIAWLKVICFRLGNPWEILWSEGLRHCTTVCQRYVSL